MTEILLMVVILASMAFGGSCVFAVMSLRLADVHREHVRDWEEMHEQIQTVKEAMTAQDQNWQAHRAYLDSYQRRRDAGS